MAIEIPSEIVKEIIEEWAKEYGPTFPLYGNNTVRHDISGSVRPLLSSTEIPHVRILAESSGIPKKTIQKIMNGDIATVTEHDVEILINAMDRNFEWYDNARLKAYV